MKKRYGVLPVLVALVLGLSQSNEAEAVGALAESYIDVTNLVFRPADAALFTPDEQVQVDTPVTDSSGKNNGEPDAGSSVLTPPARGPLNVDQACVAGHPPIEQDPPFAPPCPPNDTFSEVLGFPANNLSRSDTRIVAEAGYVYPGIGATCPDDGLGACGDPANVDGPDINSISEVQLNQSGDTGDANSGANNIFRFNLARAVPIVVEFDLDWCRQAELTVGATGISKAQSFTTMNVTITNQDTGQVVFNAVESGLYPALTGPNSVNDESNAVSPGPKFNSLDVFGTVGDLGDPQRCFPRPGGNTPVTIDTSLAGFVTEPGVEYTIAAVEVTRVDAQLEEEITPDVYKWYFGKQSPRQLGLGEEQLPIPVVDSVVLNDQFGSREHEVTFLKGLMTPAGKNEPVDPAREDHLTCYDVDDISGQFPQRPRVRINTANFGDQVTRLRSSQQLCVAAQKEHPEGDFHGSIVGPAYLCYATRQVMDDIPFTLDDQFGEENVTVTRLSRVCTPVGVNDAEPPTDPSVRDHLACYDYIRDRSFPLPVEVGVDDRFIDALGLDVTFNVERSDRFCEAASKTVL